VPLEPLDLTRDSIQTSAGKAAAFNILRLRDLGYEVERLPYSVRILLENAVRHSGSVKGALEAAHALAKWPDSIGEETPFMPYRVLLQDYTGVPLVVDLAAMRDAARGAGLDPKLVNSKVPVDLVIDHSIQVDAWGNDLAFNVNLEKEYERNSERYSFLKWAQSSFRGTRVFPPGKGICHQFNLEYLSKVVATTGREGEVMALPDTLVGTDSHTTMVNGLGCLGWGVGGIEAEAVMLGEPYHMPIPRVIGVKFVGALREGVTPTDLVLTVTERLREKNVVGTFVEYFGEGYGQLSVPDRATIGNMSPEYGATVGFCPVDDATLAYLKGTARPKSQVDLVERYSRKFGFFVNGVEPEYSEILTLDLDKVEPSIAGPRNPEERHILSSVPSFARGLLDKSTTGGPSGGGTTIVSRGLLMLEEDGPVMTGVQDGSVVIAAITSCTNTSNPTVMVGAGLIAKRAIELGLSVRPWVKPSLAPGSRVVTDYLQNSDLLNPLDTLGFALVGYGCTTCIAEGTPVLLADGTSRPIENMPPAGGANVFGPDSKLRLGIAPQSQLMEKGLRECVELVLQDGRSLICTPDHKILCSDGRWLRADELLPGKDRVMVGLEAPVDKPGQDESGYVLYAGDLTLRMDSELERNRTLAFARLLGHLLNDGSISVLGQGRMNVGQALDRRMVLNDIELLTGRRPVANRYDELKWSIVLPMALTKSFAALAGVQAGRRIDQLPTLPEFVCQTDCPVAVVREFLGGLFGADGHGPILHRWGSQEDDSNLEHPAYSQSTIPAYLEKSREYMLEIIRVLARCGVKTEGAQIYDYPTRRSSSSYPPPQDGVPRIEVRLTLPDGLSFVERVGFRYSVDKSMRASAAAVYWRLVDGIHRQRLWMAARLRDLHHEKPMLSFSQARQQVAVSLLSHQKEQPLPPVVSPHYALLEGYDRFSRLPEQTGRKFRPLHRESFDFPSPVKLFYELGVRHWFAPLRKGAEADHAKRYCVEKEATTLPAFSLKVMDRRPAGQRLVYDLAVNDLHAFIAGTVAVHNCIGNSGPLAPEIEQVIKQKELYTVAVLSGNRNFDGRIHPLVKGSFLMSPMLVVAYALAGRIDFDFASTPLGRATDGKLVYLKDLWPSLAEIKQAVQRSLSPTLYSKRYADAMKGDERWESLTSFADDVYHWDDSSTYIRRPAWFDPSLAGTAKNDILGARALAVLDDKVTTDHISPAGTIPVDSPAGSYLKSQGVDLLHLSTYGSRRGNHEVMVRGGFSNIRLRNALAGGKEGGYTKHLPDGQIMTIFDAAMLYAESGTPLIIIAGKQYGAGSSRDWAAKAPKLLGVRAVLAESFERIHRSNLVAMGVIPLQFREGESSKSLGLTGEETFDIRGIAGLTAPKEWADVIAHGASADKKLRVLVRVDNETEMEYLSQGGVLPYVFGKLHKSGH
jgi:aconitase A